MISARFTHDGGHFSHRYSEFRSIHRKLVAAGLGGVVQLPLLPPKRSYSTQDERFAERRRAELEGYLQLLVREPELRSCPELHGFLELGLLLRRTNARTSLGHSMRFSELE
jgi:hypothetical protein